MAMIITYMVFFILQIVLLVLSVRRNTKKLWMSLFCAECISILIAFGVGVYYNIYGGPNFEGFFEVLISFVTVMVYGLLFLVSIFVKRKNKDFVR